MYNPDPIIEALASTLAPEVRDADAVGLRKFIDISLLDSSQRRPYLLADFLAERPDLERPLPLVYDRPSQLVFVGGLGEHERIAGQLYHFRTIAAHPVPDWEALRWACIDDRIYAPFSDKFIETGMGFLMGSPTAARGERLLHLGADVRFNAAERRVFSVYRTQRVGVRDGEQSQQRSARER